MEREQAKRIVEALLYMTDHALTEAEISDVLELKTYGPEVIKEIIAEIGQAYDGASSPLRVVSVAGGYQIATRAEMAPYIRRLYKERLTVRLSPSSLETLSIIAYKQPITRGEIEQIRGVEASGVMETLLERRLVKVVGRKETIGRPLLYGTTTEFLRQFGLKHLSELPDLNTLTPSDAAVNEAAVAASSDELPGLAGPADLIESAGTDVPVPPAEEDGIIEVAGEEPAAPEPVEAAVAAESAPEIPAEEPPAPEDDDRA